MSQDRVCSINGCGKPNSARGWCRSHYERWKRTGNPVPPTREELFWRNVEKTESCWRWKASVNNKGYGKFRQEYVHRVSYEWANGEIPAGMVVDHTCHNKRCVNPAHLQAVTNKENGENRSLASIRAESGYRGVFRNHNKWAASVGHHGRYHWVCGFDSPEQAAEAARELRLRLFTNSLADHEVG